MNKLDIQQNVELAALTTFNMGGKANYLIKVKNTKELKESVQFAKTYSLPIFVLGGGSNVLINDKGFDGLVIKLINDKTRIVKETKNYVLIIAGAGKKWDEFVKEVVNWGFQGVECMSGIPGTVGASPVQNIGAYGQQLKDVFVECKAYDLKNDKVVVLKKRDCKFGYRKSIFKNITKSTKYIILEVVFKLKKKSEINISYKDLLDYFSKKQINKPSIKDVRKAVLNVRSKKLEDPKKNGNAGSFFKNPVIKRRDFDALKKKHPNIPYYLNERGMVKLPAGWLVEKAGWKGRNYKNAGVSKKHALVIINRTQKSKASEIKELSEKIVKDVKKKFGITLEPEVQFVGF